MAINRKFLGYSLAGAALTAVGTRITGMVRQQRRLIAPLVAPLGVWGALEPADSRLVGVVYNPSKAQARGYVRDIERRVSELGWPRVLTRETTVLSPGTQQARELVDAGAQIVVAIGGDGTVGAVARGLLGTEVSLGIIPAGTGNLLARNLYLPLADRERSIDIALNGAAVPMDAISMRSDSVRGSQEYTFFVMSGAGLDAQVMHETSEELKAQLGWLAYVRTGAGALMGKSPRVRITVDDQPPFETCMKSVLIANCGRLQGGLQLASLADLNDGQLEVIVTSPRTLAGWMVVMGKVMRRTLWGHAPLQLPVMQHYVGKRVRIEMLEGAQPVEVDGDPVASARAVQAQVLPEVLRVQAHPDVLSFVQL
ncbi:MAG: diacylglycerol kinase family protein [Rothia sp. (in: high G+C Gram-positive bacteria)]|uniref:diacylglycerol/lipid kinase family protein n=1 Tax=Rothia sp. (in: high G+C Gram-positive bacteria) TaxID=1885016 RepID=UPI0026DF545B|nr:diacylglycerol kinase family protein [Rothia sp. (in: high G+C Gram-positive bacteria)]MDO5749707.1 diacylglycerol kinase family protein [Rothia sp. (in: high G+C Gram-positive bacteria)]